MEFSVCSEIFTKQQFSQEYFNCVGNYVWEGAKTAASITQGKVAAFVTDPANAHLLSSGRYIAGGALAVAGVYFLARTVADFSKTVVKLTIGTVCIAGCIYILNTSS